MNTHPLIGFLIVCFAAILLFLGTAVGRPPVPTPADGESGSSERAPASDHHDERARKAR